jgi:hypothetical protein
MAIQFLPIDTTEIPISIIYKLSNELYEFRFFHNSREDFITVEIWKDEDLLHSNKLVYGNNILKGFNQIPFAIIPLTYDDLYSQGYSDKIVTLENLGNTINLYFDDGL